MGKQFLDRRDTLVAPFPHEIEWKTHANTYFRLSLQKWIDKMIEPFACVFFDYFEQMKEQLESMGYKPMVFRYFCLNAHYRKKLNFTFETMDAAKTSYERLVQALLKHKNSNELLGEEKINEYKKQFASDISDDLNIPSALGVMWTMLKETPSKDVYETALYFDNVFGLGLKDVKEEKKVADIPAEIIEKAEKMQEARKVKDYATADVIRAELSSLGYAIKNTKDGYEIEKR